ncbi:MAG TPA: NUDIX hydrolase [Hyphomonadaceae bacterium]|nr:NUDIX hydrolase [Hyphomonadaceae bacterium]
MTKPFDPDDDPAQVAAAKAAAAKQDPLGEPDAIRAEAAQIPGEPPVPRDAATLILYRLSPEGPRILMGCRSEGHDFMPNKYVFPGGRVDEEDAAVPAISELREDVDTQLRFKNTRATRAFPLTAIREVFEETGLIVGKAFSAQRLGQTLAAPPSWADYYAQGAAPCLEGFDFIGRAITPPMRHKRFDARFFMADAASALIDDRPPIDGRELNDLRWFTLPEVAALDLPNVTRFVISEVEARLVRNEAAKPFYLYWAESGHVRERIG